MKTYPLKLRPIFKERIWGGQNLRDFFGKEIPEGVNIGESWELADLPDDKSVIENGELKGKSFSEILEMYPEEITGDADFKGPFPLLIKLLDAQDVLSVQVHPDEQTCKRMGKGDPKTECWYIVEAKPGAAIYKGLKEGVTKEQFAKAIEDGTTEELLQKVPVEPGECHFLPSGTVHAIGAGLLIAEIQMSSDTTYRVFDWNRVDASGKSRELHISESLESIHFDQQEDLEATTVGRLVDCDYFKVDKGHRKEGQEVLLSKDMKILIFVEGSGSITDSQGNGVDFKAGDTILIPAEYEGVMEFSQESKYLITRL